MYIRMAPSTYVVRNVNVNLLVKWQELLHADGGRFEINQLLFADGAALVANPDGTELAECFYCGVAYTTKLREVV